MSRVAEVGTSTLDRMTGPRRRARWIALGIAGSLVLIGSTWFHRPLFEGNFAVVDPGRFYRSAQPKGNWEYLIKTYGLASILNLRGGSENDWWYTAEVKAAKGHSIDFYDVPMSPSRRPSRRELLALVDLLGRCRYPMLIHCKSGADRTGLVTSLYLLTQNGLPPDQAHAAFTLSHAHIPLLGPQHLHEPIHEYATWLQKYKLRHTPALFRNWVTSTYMSDEPELATVVIEPGRRPWNSSSRRDRFANRIP